MFVLEFRIILQRKTHFCADEDQQARVLQPGHQNRNGCKRTVHDTRPTQHRDQIYRQHLQQLKQRTHQYAGYQTVYETHMRVREGHVYPREKHPADQELNEDRVQNGGSDKYIDTAAADHTNRNK